MERAFDSGCLDCWFTPIQMKKNRPATLVSILCEAEKVDVFKELLFTETSTLGVRVSRIERECLNREKVKMQTEFGEIDVKIAKFGDKIVNIKPEYDQMREIAVKSKIPLREIEQRISREIKG
jgi:pyridinium-3,5-bisthiocarboxylic acid mononucleotide nickel chelatase